MSAVETVSIKIKVFGDFPEYYIVQTPFPAVPEHGVARGLPGAPHGQLWFRARHPTAASAARPPRIAETQPGNGQAAGREPRMPGQQGSAEPHGQPARAGIRHTDLCHVGWEAPARAASSALWPRRVSGMQAEPGWPQVLAGTEHRCGTPALCHTLRVGGGRPRLLPALAGSRCAGFS